MEIETISKVGGSYSSSEPSVSKAVATDVMQAETASEPITTASVEPTSHAGDKKEDGNAKGKKEHQPSEATINDAVSSANRRMERTRCEYSYHKETNRVSIKVFDADTDEVIREIPPEKSLDMLQKMWEMAGILVDERR